MRRLLREREHTDIKERRAATAACDAGPSQANLFEAYVTARESTGQGTKGLTEAKLAKVLEKQEAAIRKKTGCQRVRFRVVVEAGKAKVKATPLRG